jgi:hypothetical protein
MRKSRRRRLVLASAAAAGATALIALVAGCGEDTVAPPPDPGTGPGPTGPFEMTQIFLRPLAIERPPLAGGRPTPSLAEYALSAFYTGGTELATFEWTVPATIGSVQPKTVHLGRADATVVIRGDGKPPLGFFEISAAGRSGDETGSLTQRFAVVENRWMKHRRNIYAGKEPEDLAQWPTFITAPGRTVSGDTLLYVFDNEQTRKILAFPAFANLNGAEPVTSDVVVPPSYPNAGNQAQTAPQTQPDVAPAALGRREMLFSSRIDPQYAWRCPRQPCDNTPPFRIFVVRLPSGIVKYTPRALTPDTTYIGAGGQPRWIAYNYSLPKWDPKATGAVARIAFLSDRTDEPSQRGQNNLWFGDLLDSNGDSRSDSLTNLRQVTSHAAISSFSWHPDGTRICIADGFGLAWVNVGSGDLTRIQVPDPLISRPALPAIFSRPGEHTLIAFQAQAENLRNLYILDEEDGTLAQALPFPIPVSHSLFPNWHPTRKALAYVSDYTVRAWANSSGGTGSPPDRINPTLESYYSMSRTLYASPWVLSFEDY